MGSLTPYKPALPNEFGVRPNSDGIDLGRLWAAISRRWRLLIAIVAGFVLLVAAFTILTPKAYTTTVRLIAGTPQQDNSGSSTTLPILNALVLQSGEQSAETFATLAQQEDVAAAVVQNQNLRIEPRALLNHVAVKPVVNTAILDLSVTWSNAADSAKIANAFGDAFILSERDFVRSQANAALTFLSSEIPHAESTMRQTATDLANFQATHGFVDASSHTKDIVSHATDVESKIDAARLDAREAHALLDNVNSQMASVPPSVNAAQQITVNPLLTDLRSKLQQIDLQLQDARGAYTERHPLVISLKKQRADILAQIGRQPVQVNSANTLAPNPLFQSLQQQAAQYKQRIDGDAAQLSLLSRERAAMSPILHSLPQQSMQLATLQQRAKLASDVYNALEQKYNDATIAKTTAISDITIVQHATADSAVVRPNLKINVLAALIVGILIASVVVFVLDAVQRPVREGEQARVLGLPVIARIPAFNKDNPRMLPWVRSMTIEAFLQLCVSLKLKSRKPMRTLAVTSPSRGDGKSTIAFHLANAMANLQQQVLLVDADLRKPSLHHLANCNNNIGLSDVLLNVRTLLETVKEISPNLHLLPAGRNASNPVAMMQSPQFDDLLVEASSRYSMVIIDTPALMAVSDALLVSAKTDATLLVIAANLTNENDANEVIARFSALGLDNFAGVVLNKDTKRFSDYGDYFTRSGLLSGGTQ